MNLWTRFQVSSPRGYIKDLKFEIRQVNATINELATDQAGDITYLHQEIVELKNQIQIQNLFLNILILIIQNPVHLNLIFTNLI